MKRNWLPFIGLMVAMFFLIAIFQSPVSMYLGGIVFAMAALQLPGIVLAVLALCAMLIFIFFFGHVLAGGYIALTFILPGIVIGQLIRNKRSLSECLTAGALSHLLPELLFFHQISLFNQTTVRDMFFQSMHSYTNDYIALYGKETGETIKSFASVIEQLLPSMFVIASTAFSFFLLVAVKCIMRRRGMPLYWMRPLTQMKIEPVFLALVLLSGFGAYVTSGAASLILLNVAVVFIVLYAAVGVAFSVKLLQKCVKSNLLCGFLIMFVWILTSGVLYPFMGMMASFARETDIHKTNR